MLQAEEAIAKGESPIVGMDIHMFQDILNERDYEDMRAQYGVKQKYMTQFPVRMATKKSLDKYCAICCLNYVEGNKVFFLPCSHHFHIECVLPWFNKSHKCPNCRYDLNQGEEMDEGIVESEQYGNPDLFK